MAPRAKTRNTIYNGWAGIINGLFVIVNRFSLLIIDSFPEKNSLDCVAGIKYVAH